MFPIKLQNDKVFSKLFYCLLFYNLAQNRTCRIRFNSRSNQTFLTSSKDLTKTASTFPPLSSAPNPTFPPLRSVIFTNPDDPLAVPVAWNMVAARAVPLVIW